MKWRGVTLGIYQAHALGCPVAALVTWIMNHDFIALMYIVGAGFGWAGWKRDFDLAWTPRRD